MKGSCLCGAVRFEVSGPVEGPSVCHCTQCRKQSGHLWASAFAPEQRVSIAGPVQWYEATPQAKRGFCPA